MSDDQPYEVLGPGQILLSPTAREWARQFGMTESQMAKHLMEQDRLRKAGQIQGTARMEAGKSPCPDIVERPYGLKPNTRVQSFLRTHRRSYRAAGYRETNLGL